ncbi:hypothetical protein B0T26DRAFT_342917 [Lasiosphaeria miniovina]|uniref:Nephrocystin 3-like N-terminal domain-containing protein n=1 Tax=Lasiosphaeria miniovina TaxID=1954250 RepID=A0AA40AB92_9PEZI|nr:uncharacterized protein B0T26DRAFT_342917 [Lasiosphaeria miniovina]KAK0712646.1 hypothetical protein B0T26DRAFT_342917 [Lasiosphaeria miniovina]
MQRQEIYEWLHATDPSTLHHQACDRYEIGTGDWVLRLDQWKAWLEGGSRSIWIRGIPGAGKTILGCPDQSSLITSISCSIVWN